MNNKYYANDATISKRRKCTIILNKGQSCSSLITRLGMQVGRVKQENHPISAPVARGWFPVWWVVEWGWG